MSERIFTLDSIEPIDFYGLRNDNLRIIVQAFPDLKIVARGTEIKVRGGKENIDEFEFRLEKILCYVRKYRSISEDMLNNLLDTTVDYACCTPDVTTDLLLYGNTGKQIKARTENQKKLVEKAMHTDLLFAIGPAGTGKTYTAVALAVKALKERQVQRIILCRPAVEADEKLGFLPGDLREKLNPYLQPLYDALLDMMPYKRLQDLIHDNIIQIAPLAYMRGRTLDNAFVILDEAQNATLNQLKMFLTRMGERAKFIITGDMTQIDLPDKGKSGLRVVVDMLHDTKGIETIVFEHKDVIRHTLVKQIINKFDAFEAQPTDKA